MTRRFLLFFIILYFLVNSIVFAQVDTAWVRRYNETICGIDYATAIADDSFGYVYVTGWSGTSNLPDYLTIKINPIGETLWVRTYDGPVNGSDWAYAIVVDNQDNVLVTGESEGLETGYDLVTVKYNSSGQEQWVARYNGFGDGEDYPCSIRVDNQGNVYVAGSSDVTNTGIDYATIKYNSSGTVQWVQRYNGTDNGDDIVHSMVIDDSGNVYNWRK